MLLPNLFIFEAYLLQFFLVLLNQFRSKSGLEHLQVIILFEKDTANLANALTMKLFASNTSAHIVQLESETMFNTFSIFAELPTWHEDCIVIAMFEKCILYLDLVAAFPALAVMQTILISHAMRNSELRALAAGFAVAPRLLLVTPIMEKNHKSQQSLNLHVFPIESPFVPVQLNHTEVFAQHANPAAALFWNDVRHINHPLSFEMDLVPILHIRQCPEGNRCFAFGLHVMLANILATYLNTVPEIEFKRSFVNEYYESTPYRCDFGKYANLRDGLLTFKPNDSVTIVDPVKAIRVGIFKGHFSTDAFDVQEIVLIVPYRRRTLKCGAEMQMLEKRLGIFAVWITLVLVISCLRYADSERSQFSSILLNTWAQSAGNGTQVLFALTLSQRIAVGVLAAFAILGGSYFSGEMYQNMFSCPPQRQIDSLEDFYVNTDLHMLLSIETFPAYVK